MHSHAHGHSHGGAGPSSTTRALTWALVLNGAFLVVELVLGLLTGSLALLSDAAHMVSDVGALALALGAAHLAQRAASGLRTYGWRRAEVLGAFVNGLTLLVACAVILSESIQRLVHGAPDVAFLPVLIGGTVGLVINLGSAWVLMRSDTGNLNVRGALLHMLADALGSVGAIVAALGLHLGYPAADPIAGLLIAVLVLAGSVGLLRDAAKVLLQFGPTDALPEDLVATMLEVEGVAAVHDVHVWSLDGQRTILTAHVVLDEPADPFEVSERTHAHLAARHKIDHCTIQVERGEGCGGCALELPPKHSLAGSHPTVAPEAAHDHHDHDHAH